MGSERIGSGMRGSGTRGSGTRGSGTKRSGTRGSEMRGSGKHKYVLCTCIVPTTDATVKAGYLNVLKQRDVVSSNDQVRLQ